MTSQLRRVHCKRWRVCVKVKIADTEYGYKLLTQLLKFPAGSRDDAVDMAALMAKAIDVAHPAIVLPPKTQEPARGAKTIQEMVDRFEQQQARTRRI
jgi:hypothetical protein